MPQLLLSGQYGEHEFQWQEMYGQVYSIKGCFGQTRLIISDPLTIKYILNNDVFVCGPSLEKATNAVWGRNNVLVLRGHPHRHLRNIMNPSFSSNNIRELLPVIRETGRKLASRWESLGFVGSTVDIARTLNDAALDLIGDAILENPFNALVGQSELAGMQRALTDAVSSPTELGQLFDAALPYIPDLLLRGISHLPIPGTQMFRKYMKLTDELALQLAGQQRDEGLEVGRQSLIGSFVTSDVPTRDIGTHLRSILVAGADTSGGTMGWILYKLAQMADFQQDVREEIRLSKLEDQGDYDNMPLLNAIINEVLRMYSVFPLAERVASEDCLLPLIEPITTVTGAQISEIPIKKGQCLYVAISAYHRLRSIWGPDASEFRPSRWLEKEPCKGPALGPHASLLTFYGGPGVCLGWRLAILELQVFVAEIVGRFILSVPENDSVRPRLALTLVAETADGTRQIPVHIEAVT
ncbi:cytochrome P450 [Mycena galericulata]|nr:cytochrome P450 [Mycena galericulata]